MQDWYNLPNASDTIPWYKNRGALKLNFFHSIICVGLVLNGFDGTIISRVLALPSWKADIGHPGSSRIGFLNAISYIAGFCAGPIIAWVDEVFGRRWGCRFYSYTMIIGTILGATAGLPGVNGYALFATSRAIIGLGLASFLMTSLVIVHEISHPRNRQAIAAAWDSYWILGSVIASWLVFGTSFLHSSWSWRIPYLVQVPMALYVLIGIQFVPETPRFLIAKGRDAEALQFFIDYHGNGNPEDELVLFEYEQMRATIRLEQEAQAEKWSKILRTKGSLHRLALAGLMTFCTKLSGVSVMRYYFTTIFTLVGIRNPTVQTAIGAGLSVFSYIVQITSVLVGRHVGSKTILLWVWPFLLLALVGVMASMGTYIEGDRSRSGAIATAVMVWIYTGLFNFANPVLYSYPAEVQTYSLRSKGLLVWNSIYQILGAFTTWVDPIGLEAIGWKYFAVFIPLIVLQWTLMKLFMVETHGHTLEAIARAFESDDTLVPTIDLIHAERNRSRSNGGGKGQDDVESK